MADHLWSEYQTNRSQESRNRLVEHYWSLTHAAAGKLRHTLTYGTTVEDLASSGVQGLIDAVERFDPSQGKFESYAFYRIRGAILDDYRRLSWVPRKLVSAFRALAEINRDEHSYTEAELADVIGVDVAELRKLMYFKGYHNLSHLDATMGADGDGISLSDMVASPEDGPEEILLKEYEDEEVARYVSELTDSDEVVTLSLYFFDELNLRQIGEVIGVTESRVSQIKKSALRHMRELYGG